MGYIARVAQEGGKFVVTELREGQVAQIYEEDRPNWRAVGDSNPPVFDYVTSFIVMRDLVVSEDGSSVTLSWEVVPKPAPILKFELSRYATNRSYQLRITGMGLPNGIVVDSSNESVAMINGAIKSLEEGWVQEPVSFSALNGSYDLTLADLKGVAGALAAFIQMSFAKRSTVRAQIADGTLTSTAAVDAALL